LNQTEPFAIVDILGVPVACLSRAGLLDTVGAWISQPQPRTVAYVNAHCMNLAYADADYRRMLNQADLVYPDGVGVVWAGRFLSGLHRCSIPAMTKLTGADWLGDFCARAAQQGWRLYFLAGKAGVAQQAARQLQAQYPGLTVVGTHHGYISSNNMDVSDGNITDIHVINKINASRAQVVLVGIGVPLQEKWVSLHRSQIEAPVCWTVGALFDYVAGIERRVPTWMNAAGFEWLWRLAMNPRGKWRRYLLGNPLFVARVLLGKWKGRRR
jgi:N-acetylglucosaminyldiphosphoundecaprenol N-acetyl-beta-D-mannosaminyltransferase